MPTTSPSTPDDPAKTYKDFLGKIKAMESSEIEHKKPLRLLYVIYSHEKNSVLHDPMTNKPVIASNPKHLEEAAKAFKGEIITAQAARDKLLKFHRN